MQIDKIANHFAAQKEAKQLQFPYHLLPAPITEIIEHYNEHRGYPKDFLAASILSAIGSAVGDYSEQSTPHSEA